MFSDISLQFLQFSIVGFSGIIIDFSVTYLLIKKLGFNKYLSHSVAFIFAVINNFILNKFWTFSESEGLALIQFQFFFLISLIGLLLSIWLVYVLHSRLKVKFYYAKFWSIIVIAFWNFTMNYAYTF